MPELRSGTFVKKSAILEQKVEYSITKIYQALFNKARPLHFMISSLVSQTYQEQKNDIRPQSIKTYNTYIRSYCKTMKELGLEGEPLPPTDTTMRAFIQWGVTIRIPKFSFATVKLLSGKFCLLFPF